MRTYLTLLALSLPVACKKQPTPAPAPQAEDTTDDQAKEALEESDIVVAEDPVTGRLTLSTDEVTVGEPLTVHFIKTGLNGCYTQTNVETSVDGTAWTHAYTTAHEGEVCTANIPLGGFQTTVTPTAAGTWTGRVLVDDEEIVSYTIEATPVPAVEE